VRSVEKSQVLTVDVFPITAKYLTKTDSNHIKTRHKTKIRLASRQPRTKDVVYMRIILRVPSKGLSSVRSECLRGPLFLITK